MSVSVSIFGSGTCSTRMSLAPCQVTARMYVPVSAIPEGQPHPEGWQASFSAPSRFHPLG